MNWKNIAQDWSAENSRFIHSDGSGLIIGDDVEIGPFVSIICRSAITIKYRTIISSGAVIVDHDHAMESEDINSVGCKKNIFIGHHCWIGANAVILKGVILGNYCVVGAGAVVLEGNYEDGSVLVGNPARVVKKRTVFDK